MGGSLPGLMKLYDEFKDRRKDFEIIAFHDTKAKTFEELDARLEQVKSRHWGGRDLPFPILLDSTGNTLRNFGVSSFPTIIVIDPKGKVVKHGGETTVRLHLMETDPEVKKALRQLKGARKPERFDAAVKALVDTGSDKAGFALAHFADKATPEQRAKIGAALEKMGGIWAVGFFFGDHGLQSKDKQARLAAAKAIAKIGDKNLLFSLARIANNEPDAEVKKVLNDAITELNGR